MSVYINPIAGSPKPTFIKGFDTFDEISKILFLEDHFHDGEIWEINIDNDEIAVELMHEGKHFTIKCLNPISKYIDFDLDTQWLYEIEIKKKDDYYIFLVDEGSIEVKAKSIIIEEVIITERACYTKEEKQAIDLKVCNPDVYVRCPRCGKELRFRSVGNSYEIRCCTDGCIKAECRGI